MTSLRDVLHALIAQTAPDAPTPGCAAGTTMVPLLLMVAIIYFLMIRPQQKQQRKHAEMLAALQKGDEVVTQGGIIGRIFAITDREVTLEVANGVRMRVLKGQIAGKYREGASDPAVAPETK